MPVVLTELPFKLMALALTVMLANAAALPTALLNTTVPPPLLLIVKPRAVLSLLMLLLAVIMAVLSVASNKALLPKVMAPA